MPLTGWDKDIKNKSFCFVAYVDWNRMRNGTFRLLYRLIHDLNDDIREGIRAVIGLFCPLCFASKEHIQLDGTEKRKYSTEVIRYYCSVCGNHFSTRTLSPFYRKQYPEVLILCALALFYELRQSPREITRLVGLPLEEGILRPTLKTVSAWLLEYAYLFGLGGLNMMPDNYGKDIREADELYKQINGERAYTLGTLDRGSRFVYLADAWKADSKELQEFLMNSHLRFGSKPKRYETDGWHGYQKPIEKLSIPHGVVFHKDEWKSKEGFHTNGMERYWSTYRLWLRTARGYKKMENSDIFSRGFETFYDFLRPHMTLNGNTPAQAKGIIEIQPWHHLIVKGMLVNEPGWRLI